MEERVKAGEYATVVLGVSGDLYTTAPEDYPEGKTALMATLASAMPTFRALPFKSFRTIFILPPSFEVWLERLEEHAFTPEQLERRLAEAKMSLEFALHQKDVRFVVNDALPQAVEDLRALAHGKAATHTDQASARALVRILINRIS
jgi:guanylate kinase